MIFLFFLIDKRMEYNFFFSNYSLKFLMKKSVIIPAAEDDRDI